MVKRVVRITRTWEVEVDAEYGDSDADLLERAKPGTISEAKETRSLLPMGVTIADLEDPDGPEPAIPRDPEPPPPPPPGPNPDDENDTNPEG
jgi:hypothetical protein